MAAKEGGALRKIPHMHMSSFIRVKLNTFLLSVRGRKETHGAIQDTHKHTHKQALTDGCIHGDGGQTDGRTDGGCKGTLADVCLSVSHQCMFQSHTKMRKVLTSDAQNSQHNSPKVIYYRFFLSTMTSCGAY